MASGPPEPRGIRAPSAFPSTGGVVFLGEPLGPQDKKSLEKTRQQGEDGGSPFGVPLESTRTKIGVRTPKKVHRFSLSGQKRSHDPKR